jgi:hypothetical protein
MLPRASLRPSHTLMPSSLHAPAIVSAMLGSPTGFTSYHERTVVERRLSRGVSSGSAPHHGPCVALTSTGRLVINAAMRLSIHCIAVTAIASAPNAQVLNRRGGLGSPAP